MAESSLARGGEDDGEEAHGADYRGGYGLGARERHALGDELAEDDRYEGREHDDDRDREGAGRRGEEGNPAEALLEPPRDRRASEGPGEGPDEGYRYLYGRKESRGILGRLERQAKALLALIGLVLEPRLARGDDRHLGEREEAV